MPGAQAETPRALTRTSTAPPRGRQSYLQQARARMCAPTLRSLPCPHGRACAVRAARRAGPLRRARRSSPAPSRGPAGGRCVLAPGRSLCAPPNGGGGGEGCDGTGRRGWRAAPPPGSPEGRLRAQGRRKEALRAGRNGARCPAARPARSLSARVPPSAAGPAGAPGSWRARSPSFVLGSAWLAGPRALTLAVPAERPGPRIR